MYSNIRTDYSSVRIFSRNLKVYLLDQASKMAAAIQESPKTNIASGYVTKAFDKPSLSNKEQDFLRKLFKYKDFDTITTLGIWQAYKHGHLIDSVFKKLYSLP